MKSTFLVVLGASFHCTAHQFYCCAPKSCSRGRSVILVLARWNIIYGVLTPQSRGLLLRSWTCRILYVAHSYCTVIWSCRRQNSSLLWWVLPCIFASSEWLFLGAYFNQMRSLNISVIIYGIASFSGIFLLKRLTGDWAKFHPQGGRLVGGLCITFYWGWLLLLYAMILFT